MVSHKGVAAGTPRMTRGSDKQPPQLGIHVVTRGDEENLSFVYDIAISGPVIAAR
jgi:hypothetical protein